MKNTPLGYNRYALGDVAYQYDSLKVNSWHCQIESGLTKVRQENLTHRTALMKCTGSGQKFEWSQQNRSAESQPSVHYHDIFQLSAEQTKHPNQQHGIWFFRLPDRKAQVCVSSQRSHRLPR